MAKYGAEKTLNLETYLPMFELREEELSLLSTSVLLIFMITKLMTLFNVCSGKERFFREGNGIMCLRNKKG